MDEVTYAPNPGEPSRAHAPDPGALPPDERPVVAPDPSPEQPALDLSVNALRAIPGQYGRALRELAGTRAERDAERAAHDLARRMLTERFDEIETLRAELAAALAERDALKALADSLEAQLTEPTGG